MGIKFSRYFVSASFYAHFYFYKRKEKKIDKTKSIDSEQHVTPYGTSEEWQQENYQNIKEFYYIDKLKPESIN